MRIDTTFGRGYAWKAIYIFSSKEEKLCYLGIDPKSSGCGIKPQLFGGWGSRDFRIDIPYLRYTIKESKIQTRLRNLQDRLWSKLDTRYAY